MLFFSHKQTRRPKRPLARPKSRPLTSPSFIFCTRLNIYHNDAFSLALSCKKHILEGTISFTFKREKTCHTNCFPKP